MSDFFKNLFHPVAAPTIKAPKIEQPSPLKTSLDPQTLTVTIEPKLAKAIHAGSAEAQALAFQFATISSPAGASAPRPVAAPVRASALPGGTLISDNRRDENERRNQTFLDKIEKNTRQPLLAVATFT